MSIEFICPQCSKTLRVPDDAQGKTARCPNCTNLMTVPSESGLAPSTFGPAPVPDDHSAGSKLVDEPYPPNSQATSQTAKPTENPFANIGPANNPSTKTRPSPNPYQSTSAGYTDQYDRGESRYGRMPRHMLANRGKRFLGAMLDVIITLVAVSPGIFIYIVAESDRDEVLQLLGAVLFLAGMLVVGIINWIMISQSGQSIAKKLLGMQIVLEANGSLPGFVNGVILRSWVPAIINQICSLFSIVDALFIFGDEHKCVHDHIAQTVVIDLNQRAR